MFDVLEHVPDQRRALEEAFRVLKPGGYLLLSTPNETWQFPYYRFMAPLCPSEEEKFAEWGHVRRGYSREQLETLTKSGRLPCDRQATFISPITVLCHDVAFSNASARVRRVICLALFPVTWAGYAVHRASHRGTETAYTWQKRTRDEGGRGPRSWRRRAPACRRVHGCAPPLGRSH